MLKDRIARFFWGQFRKPSGLFGRVIGNRMAEGNTYDAKWTISLLDIQPKDNILEIGFGPGVSSHYAAEKATKGFVAGIDHSETMVQAARKRNIEIVQAGRMDLKLPCRFPMRHLTKSFRSTQYIFGPSRSSVYRNYGVCSSQADCWQSPSSQRTNGANYNNANRICGRCISVQISSPCLLLLAFVR